MYQLYKIKCGELMLMSSHAEYISINTSKKRLSDDITMALKRNRISIP